MLQIERSTDAPVTDEDGNAWFDRRGYEWSNSPSGCVKTR